jgi:hypothetical protein
MTVETIEMSVLEIFRDVLRNGAIGEDADFFESGGDSLLVGKELDPVVIFMYPTPASCAGAVMDLG